MPPSSAIAPRRVFAIAFFGAICCCAGAVWSQTSASTSAPSGVAKAKPTTIVWQSGNITANALPTEFAQLFEALEALKKAGGSVTTKEIKVKQGESIEDALRQAGVFGGKAMPIQVDQYVCGLNLKQCSFINDKPNWKIQPNATIVVPDLQMEPVIVHRTATKSAKDTLEGIIRDREGCPKFDDACLLYLKNLNRRRPGEISQKYVGTLTVPTRAYRATIELESPVAGDPLLLPEVANLRKQAVPAVRGRLFAGGAGAATVEGSRARVLNLIGFPPNGGTGFELPSTGVSQVTVIDNWVDADHCMLKNVKVFEAPVTPASSRPPCGGRASAQKARDHGTHVVGLISAMTDTEAGPGINPRAMVNVIAINVDQLTDEKYAADQYDRFGRLLNTPNSPDVVNMSFEYRPKGSAQNDLIWEAMKQQEGNILFVAAAGNDGKMLSAGSECSVRPACQQAPNVITVGALSFDERSKMYQGPGGTSNFGNAVHVGVPASNIVSTIAMNRVGTLSGTSQAAPIVTGVASLLYLKDRKLRPSQVKNRIIYTSDLFPELYASMLGGRLNATRAIDFERAYVKRFGKTLERLVLKDNSPIPFADRDNQGETLWIQFGQIRRLKFEPELNYHVLYYTKDANKESGELLRRFVRPLNNQAIDFSAALGQAQRRVDVRLKDIEDYTAAIVR